VTTSIDELLPAARCGEQWAWDSLVEGHSRLLWAVARSYRLGQDDAADLVSATWVGLVEEIDGIEEADQLMAWLVATVRGSAPPRLDRTARCSDTLATGSNPCFAWWSRHRARTRRLQR
jgi:RNA polymerase sigma factor (sigma-70 family)